MILVFGGTTEGRKAIEVLEEGGSEHCETLGEDVKGATYFYSTKTGEQDITLHHGQRIDGALDADGMRAFCREHGIRLMVDAAHPFASKLHETIAQVAVALNIPVVRYERIYPPRNPDILWIDDYSDLLPLITADSPLASGHSPLTSLLATTGVQSISKLKPLEATGIKVYYRILDRESSIALALKQGAGKEQLCYYNDPTDIPVKADAILLKESGITGGFLEKVAAAKALGMKIIALKRPEYANQHSPSSVVNGPYGLRRAIEKQLPEFYPLHSGLTTGTCATAAAVAAALQLLKGEMPSEVPVVLPDGETIAVPVGYGDGYAFCVKDAGDDPDVTNGLEIRATCQIREEKCGMRNGNGVISNDIEILGGEGVGRFTLPGFDFAPGEAAINKAPRQMIRQNLRTHLASLAPHFPPLIVTISVPDGAEIARRTFNPRLGIEGGISIIGVSGIVKPFSEEAFVNSIRKCMTVAKASGADRVVINSGGKSERFVKSLYPDLPRQAFVEYGNYIGETLKIAAELDITNVTLGVMLGKAVKLAAGHLDTHSRKTTMDKTFIKQMLEESGCDIDISNITLARELWEKLPSDKLSTFADTIIRHCAQHCTPLLPNGSLIILLIDDDGNIYKTTNQTRSSFARLLPKGGKNFTN